MTPSPRPVREALAVNPDQRNDAQRDALAAHFRSIAPELDPQRKHLVELEKLAKT